MKYAKISRKIDLVPNTIEVQFVVELDENKYKDANSVKKILLLKIGKEDWSTVSISKNNPMFNIIYGCNLDNNMTEQTFIKKYIPYFLN